MRVACGIFALFVSVTCSGCVALVLGGAAGAAGVAYARGDVDRVYPHSMDTVWEATMAALGDLQLRLADYHKDQLTGEITAYTAAGDKVKIKLDSRNMTMTKLDIRVNTFGDQSMSLAILSKIDQYLPAEATAVPTFSTDPELGTLGQEAKGTTATTAPPAAPK